MAISSITPPAQALTKPHAFVVMPFGRKPDLDGMLIDFNHVYDQYLAPALSTAGLEVFRADQEQRAGGIIPDLLQELLLADLVVADLTTNNPNVWYELGVRHGLRARGVVLVCGGRSTTAFDVYTDRKLRYGLQNGALDPNTLEADRKALTDMATATMQSWRGRKISPVYYHLPNLKEPEWKYLRIGEAREYWARHDAWAARVELACKEQFPGDLLVLADEAPIAALRSDAWTTAGKALRHGGHYRYALEQLARGLEIEETLDGLREQGICLQRLARMNEPGYSVERARQHYAAILKDYPDDPETWALLGRLDKDAWTAAWRRVGQTAAAMKEDARLEKGSLLAAIENYYQGYQRNPSHYFSGINALTLMHLYGHLTSGAKFDPDIAMLTGAVRFAAVNARHEGDAFYAKATMGDLEILAGTPDSVTDMYGEAVASSHHDWFALDSSRQQLNLLKDLEFNLDHVNAGLKVFDRAIARLTKPADLWQPQKVFLFSGHMVDEPQRATPRFPNEAKQIGIARQAIVDALTKMGAGPADLALTQGACGGDLLFTEACLELGVKVQWLQPLAEPDFIQHSVIRGGESWRARYLKVNSRVIQPTRAAPDALGPPPPGAERGDIYERCNRWLLYTAISYGTKKTNFICLWDGTAGDGKGGTKHMLDEVTRRTGNIEILNTKALW